MFRDESMHMAFAFDVVQTVRSEEPGLFDEQLAAQVREMLAEAVECEVQFAEDLLGQGVSGMSPAGMRCYLQHVADRRGQRRHTGWQRTGARVCGGRTAHRAPAGAGARAARCAAVRGGRARRPRQA